MKRREDAKIKKMKEEKKKTKVTIKTQKFLISGVHTFSYHGLFLVASA